MIGMPDDKWGERALALVVLKPGMSDKVTARRNKTHVHGFAEKGSSRRGPCPTGCSSWTA